VTTVALLCFVTAILDSLCKDFLSVNVSAILYLMNYEVYGRSTASAQYFLQLAGYLGIPVIAWNADNSGLERVRKTIAFILYIKITLYKYKVGAQNKKQDFL
jgi:hypothetical protein